MQGAAPALIIGLGIAIRLWHLLANRSLYIDEARLALNIGSRSFSQLATPLDLEQIAPVPFLWAVKGTTLLFGMGEVALRLVPFLAGVALLPVLWETFRRVAKRNVALLALLLAAAAAVLAWARRSPITPDAPLMRCPDCGAAVAAGARWCSTCGRQLAPERPA